MTLALSVVVPTRDRPDALAHCLAALDGQDADIEIVVVDDASNDREAVEAVVARSPRARVIRGEGRGPAAARNRGATATRGGVIAFTDDDCRPTPRWADALAARIAAGAVAVAGPTRNGRVDDPFAAAAQIVTNHLVTWGIEPASAGAGVAFAPTSNLAVRAEVFATLPFDESFPLAAGEDRDWCDRLRAAGERLAYEPEAIVDHHPRLGWRGFWRQQVRYGRGSQHLRAGSDGSGMQPPRFYGDLLRSGFDDGPAVGGLVVLAQVATAVGVAREALGSTFSPG